jgi:ribosomal protein L29
MATDPKAGPAPKAKGPDEKPEKKKAPTLAEARAMTVPDRADRIAELREELTVLEQAEAIGPVEEFPKTLHRGPTETMVVQSQAEQDALGDEWHETKAAAHEAHAKGKK